MDKIAELLNGLQYPLDEASVKKLVDFSIDETKREAADICRRSHVIYIKHEMVGKWLAERIEELQ